MSVNTDAEKSTKPSDMKVSPSPQRSPSSSSTGKTAHRQSFTENFRNLPPSPRHRHPSLTQAAIQDLLNHPPSTSKHQNPKFVGREWRDITIGELISPGDVRWIEIECSVEEATLMLLQSPTGVVLVREETSATKPTFCFDYNDLNAYLLTVVGLSRPDSNQATLVHDIMTKAQGGAHIPLREIQTLCSREAIIKLNSDVNLSLAIEKLGSGIHRILVTEPTGDVIGIISQLRMVEFFWNEGINFPTIDQLYPVSLQDLGIGVQPIIISVHQIGGNKIASDVDCGFGTAIITSACTCRTNGIITDLYIPAATMAGALLSGKLIGVVSLTDILNTFAKSTGLHPSEPWEQRVRRRRSSSSSVRPSVESLQPNVETRR
ncbi:hypothetical protein TARUN_10145 [Trichoderma arundinaceum]|uniref:Uncharacterized protein n=1 Tax=Trichoderma arundinaceum TaxID=490622 RepID=A0A395N7M7_TRIAR|nr:hypothetical protein TARUN_10145 [Trichoderma arundinaceum]